MCPPSPGLTLVAGETHACTLREILTRIGDTWSVLVIRLLGRGPMRFGEVRKAIDGISQRMLTLTLRQLERDGLVLRTVYPTIPPRVEYALTPLGHTLLEPVRVLASWAEKHRTDIDGARQSYDSLHTNGSRSSNPV